MVHVRERRRRERRRGGVHPRGRSLGRRFTGGRLRGGRGRLRRGLRVVHLRVVHLRVVVHRRRRLVAFALTVFGAHGRLELIGERLGHVVEIRRVRARSSFSRTSFVLLARRRRRARVVDSFRRLRDGTFELSRRGGERRRRVADILRLRGDLIRLHLGVGDFRHHLHQFLLVEHLANHLLGAHDGQKRRHDDLRARAEAPTTRGRAIRSVRERRRRRGGGGYRRRRRRRRGARAGYRRARGPAGGRPAAGVPSVVFVAPIVVREPFPTRGGPAAAAAAAASAVRRARDGHARGAPPAENLFAVPVPVLVPVRVRADGRGGHLDGGVRFEFRASRARSRRSRSRGGDAEVRHRRKHERDEERARRPGEPKSERHVRHVQG